MRVHFPIFKQNTKDAAKRYLFKKTQISLKGSIINMDQVQNKMLRCNIF